MVNSKGMCCVGCTTLSGNTDKSVDNYWVEVLAAKSSSDAKI